MNFAHTLKKSQKIMLHSAKRIFLLVLCCQITACSSLIQAPAPKSDLSHYYLWLKTLNIDELKAEIERQT